MKGKTKVIALACHKGGVGKTTTAASLGGVISVAEKGRVLLVDLDPQMNLTTTFTDGSFDRTVYDAFCDFKRRRDAELPVYCIRENLDIVPSHMDMCTVDADFASFPLRDVMLKKMLAKVRDSYDWIFIDCPAQLGATTVNALVAAEKVLIPMSCDAYSVDGLSQVMNFIELVQEVNTDLDVLGVVVTKFRRNRVADQVVVEELAAHYGTRLFETRIRESAAIVRAPLEKKDIYMYDRRCTGSVDYAALAREVAQKIEGSDGHGKR